MGVFWAQIGQRITSADVMGCVTPKGVPTSGFAATFPQFIYSAETRALSASPSFLHLLINAVWFGAVVTLFAKLTLIVGGGWFQRGLKGITRVDFGWFWGANRAPPSQLFGQKKTRLAGRVIFLVVV